MAEHVVVAPAVSPTGQSTVGQFAVKLGLGMVSVGGSALAGLQMVPDGPAWKPTATALATFILALGALLSGAGPGLRKQADAAAAKVVTPADAVNVINLPPPAAP